MKSGKYGKRPKVHSDNEYIRQRREEFDICLTPGCKNAIAKWATGAVSNGYCTPCTRKRRG